MNEFESIVLLMFAAVLLTAAARRVGAPYPSFLALGGVALAFIPGAPIFELEPELALALFVAPVLLDAAYDASPRDLKDNWAPLAALVVVAVGLTTIGVAWVAHTLVPGLPWAAAIALGAVVAPPDAAAATAVLRQVNLPHRLLTVLEGESLLNDATSLLIYRLAVGAVVAHSFSFAVVAPAFLLAVAGSVIVGPLLAWVFLRLMTRIEHAPSAIIMQFVTTFGVWILAEHIGLSGVLTVVAYAIAIARRAPELTPARLRIPSYAVWETVVFMMNVMAFVLIGLQIRPILEHLEPAVRVRYFTVAGAVLVTVIVVRIVWVMTYNTIARWRINFQGFSSPRPMMQPTVAGGLLVSWCGMRGVVSLAAALALPTRMGDSAFPYRDLIVLTAFCVVIGTLVLQGLTLRPLLKLLDLRDDDPVGKEVERGHERALKAVLKALDGDQSREAQIVREEYTTLLETAPAAANGNGEGDDAAEPNAPDPHNEVRLRALAAARQIYTEMRDSDEIGDDAFHRLEEELDWVEMTAAPR